MTKRSRAEVALPFKSRTQIRDFAVLAIYKTALEGAQGQVFRENIKLQKLPGFRQTEFFTKLGNDVNGDPISDKLGMVCYHNVRAFVHKENVSFTPEVNPQGKERIVLAIHEDPKGYVEPLD